MSAFWKVRRSRPTVFLIKDTRRSRLQTYGSGSFDVMINGEVYNLKMSFGGFF